MIAHLSEIEVCHDGCLNNPSLADVLSDLAVREVAICDTSEPGRPLQSGSNASALNKLFMAEDLPSKVLTALADQPFGGIIEYTGPGDIELLRSAIKRLRGDQAFINISSRTAYGSDIAYHFCSLLDTCLQLRASLKVDLSIILQEATANAILHGNLEVESAPNGTGIDGLEEQYGRVEERLATPALAARRLEISAHWTADELFVSVTNEGAGYAFSEMPAVPAERPRRGIPLIASFADSCTIDLGGWRLNFVINRQRDSAR